MRIYPVAQNLPVNRGTGRQTARGRAPDDKAAFGGPDAAPGAEAIGPSGPGRTSGQLADGVMSP